MPAQVNWSVEITGLQDLSVTVPKSHDLTVIALWNEFAASTDRNDAALDQKIMTAKIAAETISAIEDLGILGWSIQQRGAEGILRSYLNCRTENVRSFYSDVSSAEDDLSALLRLPDIGAAEEALSTYDTRLFNEALERLQKKLSEAASYYFEHVETYNKLKHGFPVIIRLDQLASGTPPTDWDQNANIVTGITRDGKIRYVDLHRTEETLTYLKNTVEGAGRAFKELARVMLFLAEHELPLEPVNL